jgi:hypothetical protein
MHRDDPWKAMAIAPQMIRGDLQPLGSPRRIHGCGHANR